MLKLLTLFPVIAFVSCAAHPKANTKASLSRTLVANNPLVAAPARLLMGRDGGHQYFYRPDPHINETPTALGIQYEDVSIQTKDDLELHAWHLKATRASQGTVVYAHGNAGNLSYHYQHVAWLTQQGYDVLAFDYRGFGRSSGSISRKGVINDTVAALEYAHKNYRKPIVLYGHSMGGAKSVAAAATIATKFKPKALIVESSFASYEEMAKKAAGLAGKWITTDDYAPLRYSSQLDGIPTLIIHGSRDVVTPAKGSRILHKAIPHSVYWEVPGAHHYNSLTLGQAQRSPLEVTKKRSQLIHWLRSHLKN